jgi:hypothetical protein
VECATTTLQGHHSREFDQHIMCIASSLVQVSALGLYCLGVGGCMFDSSRVECCNVIGGAIA